jgi:hypothetical protein
MDTPKLEVDMIPRTSWFRNLRAMLTEKQWDNIRHEVYRRAKHVCDVCGGRGPKWPVECHEVWEYNWTGKIQRLIGLMALCPDCHRVKHFGLATIQGKAEEALAHLCKVNGWSKDRAIRHVNEAADIWEKRSAVEWNLDVTCLKFMYRSAVK